MSPRWGFTILRFDTCYTYLTPTESQRDDRLAVAPQSFNKPHWGDIKRKANPTARTVLFQKRFIFLLSTQLTGITNIM